jgi:anti-sigma B factor antagonist
MLTTAPPFSVGSERNGDLTRVIVTGELDLATSPALREKLDSLRPGTKRVLVDLRDLTFMDSRGIAVLVNAALESDRDGREFRLSPVTGQVERILECTSLLNWFSYSTE